jgi:hypothetical protein
MRKLFIACLVVLVAGVSALVVAEERPDQGVFWKIRQEGTSNSQILRTLHVLTDVSRVRRISRRPVNGRSSRCRRGA